MDRTHLEQSVALIELQHDGCTLPHGNGFFVCRNNDWYLVTCLHVIRKAVLYYRHVAHKESKEVNTAISLRVRNQQTKQFGNHPVSLIDANGERTWRSYPCGESWDVAIVKLNASDLSEFDIAPWGQSEFYSGGQKLASGDEVKVSTHRKRYGDPFLHDFPALIVPEQARMLAGSRGDAVTRGMCEGDSGSVVYRICKTEGLSDEEKIELVGVFTGADANIPSVGLFHYIETVDLVIGADDDCLSRDGMEDADPDELIRRIRLRRERQSERLRSKSQRSIS
jgi:hypothetical protein